MSKIFSILIPMIFVVSLFGQTNPELKVLNQIDDLKNTNCIDSLEFKIGNFFYGMTPTHLLQIMGKPDSIIKDKYLDAEEWVYPNINFGISNNSHIYFISTESEKYSTPSGIKIGLSISEISKILNKELKDLIRNGEVQFVNCNYEVYFIFNFNKSNKLERLEIGIDLP